MNVIALSSPQPARSYISIHSEPMLDTELPGCELCCADSAPDEGKKDGREEFELGDDTAVEASRVCGSDGG